jgi:dTDP-glucose pyrophosphorylase
MINIILPIAGRGSRFAEAGFELPKPLIPIHGKPMIEVVVNNIRPIIDHQFIFVAIKEHLDHLGMRSTLERIAPGCIIVPVLQVTEGAACTLLLAKDHINNDNPLMIANSDQFVDININDYLVKIDTEEADGLIMTMRANDPKWSYVGLTEDELVNNVVEKEVISNEATVGIYNFRHGSDFVLAAENMIAKNLRINNEFYVAPAYNEMIKKGAKIVIYNVGEEYNGMHGLGIPYDLKNFCDLDVSKRAIK